MSCFYSTGVLWNSRRQGFVLESQPGRLVACDAVCPSWPGYKSVWLLELHDEPCEGAKLFYVDVSEGVVLDERSMKRLEERRTGYGRAEVILERDLGILPHLEEKIESAELPIAKPIDGDTNYEFVAVWVHMEEVSK